MDDKETERREKIKDEILALMKWHKKPITVSAMNQYMTFKGFPDNVEYQWVRLNMMNDEVIEQTLDMKLRIKRRK